ncbi:histidine phosphatase family protein [Luteipulveratus flavus]|uniref:Histidine phosphatase family protein n=1 Tax=Luteipulveratus flavus TaxID=3031728 RepID=A0ABT6CFB5_9MICO|nr:histidine phosphatase family protein [Luteipulveratus sp. YIM 133296]MDF8265976.1 histidine phosphatase family protein [Luteipulveratus sp. YIM 133296]
MRLLLIRHGQTPANVAGSLDTALPGPGLTDLGDAQADAIPEAVAGEGIEAVFASQALRAQQTAAPLARAIGVPVLELPGVHEIQAGDVEKATDEESVHAYLGVLWRWTHGELDARMPGGETGEEVLARVDDSLRHVVASGAQVAAVVSHGALIRVWTTVRAGNLAAAFARNNPLGNTGVVVVEGDPGGWLALSWMGSPLGGPGVDDADPFDGPAGEPLHA